MKHDLIIARYGELALKSDGVRKRFENRLYSNPRNWYETYPSIIEIVGIRKRHVS